jgi:serine/threonine protein kinase
MSSRLEDTPPDGLRQARILLPAEQTGPMNMTSPMFDSQQSTTLDSALGYTFEIRRTESRWEPHELGQGAFARVFLGEQRIGGKVSRKVAIKVLQNHATLAHERLFNQEVEHLRGLSDSSMESVSRILDVLHLGPLALCVCGQIYHPKCWRCGIEPLVRQAVTAGARYPVLYCPRCMHNATGQQYMLPADRVKDRLDELFVARARPCGEEHGDATGTLINFALRQAIVMERLELRLEEFASARRQTVHRTLKEKGYSLGPTQPPPPGSLGDRVSGWFSSRSDPARTVMVAQKLLLLEKVLIVEQIAEAIAWLHGTKGMVHKDLALDNVMVRFAGTGNTPWHGEGNKAVTISDVLNDLMNYQTFRAVIIDFGLSDTSVPTRAWYDDAAATGQIKAPFLSPEAKARQVTISLAHKIRFNTADKTFEVPPELTGMLMEGDTIVDEQDQDHRFEFRVVQMSGGRAIYTHENESPEHREFRRVVVENPLLEPHDVFALGTLFYYLLTERFMVAQRNGEPRRLDEDLRGLLRELTTHGTTIRKDAVQQEGLYREVRDAIQAPFWRDEMMQIILRATTRGLPGSYAQSRIHRGPDAARRFLIELKRLHHDMQRDIVSSW